MDEIIKILNELNTDDSRFLINIIKSHNSYIEDMNNKRDNTKIIVKKCSTDLKEGIINLDDIYADHYFYTKMRVKIEKIMDSLLKIDKNELLNKRILHNTIYNENRIKTPVFEKDKLDIVELIKKMSINNIINIKMVASSITDINLFKEEQINMAIEIIKINNPKEKINKIYDYTYNYLKNDFISNNYCDFIKNKCVAQRRFHLYPINRKDGCCFMEIRKCPHLKNGQCDTECLACRLFSCPFLTKRGIGYYANEFVLLKAFLNKNQRKKLVFEFYKSKEEILKKIINI